MAFKTVKIDQYGITYADPTDPNKQIRFKTTSARKNVDGTSLVNYVSEIILNDENSPTVCDQTCSNEAISVRLRVSGSLESRDAVESLINILTSNMPQFIADNVFYGFQPSTPPQSE